MSRRWPDGAIVMRLFAANTGVQNHAAQPKGLIIPFARADSTGVMQTPGLRR